MLPRVIGRAAMTLTARSTSYSLPCFVKKEIFVRDTAVRKIYFSSKKSRSASTCQKKRCHLIRKLQGFGHSLCYFLRFFWCSGCQIPLFEVVGNQVIGIKSHHHLMPFTETQDVLSTGRFLTTAIRNGDGVQLTAVVVAGDMLSSGKIPQCYEIITSPLVIPQSCRWIATVVDVEGRIFYFRMLIFSNLDRVICSTVVESDRNAMQDHLPFLDLSKCKDSLRSMFFKTFHSPNCDSFVVVRVWL